MNKEGEGYRGPYVKLWKAVKAVTRLSGSWCSAVGARLNSAWEMEQKLVAPGHCYLKGAGR